VENYATDEFTANPAADYALSERESKGAACGHTVAWSRG
jgi:hypothetical protein